MPKQQRLADMFECVHLLYERMHSCGADRAHCCCDDDDEELMVDAAMMYTIRV